MYFFAKLLIGCSLFISSVGFSSFSKSLSNMKPRHVSIEKIGNQYQLLVDGTPYYIKGAGVNYPDGHNFAALKKAGGNTFRTWSTEHAEIELKEAKKHELMVIMGIDLKKQLHGFNYNDKKAVAEQFLWVKEQINTYKNHPNLLAWVIANEPNLLFDKHGRLTDVNPKVYDAISDIIDYIHQVDPHHPVSYSFAGVIKKHIDTALAKTQNVDFVSLQVYGDLGIVEKKILHAQISKPFMITEFGPIGHWESPHTLWGQPIEEPSAVKAKSMATRMQQGLVPNVTGQYIGSFAFEWGQKQERTPTWYGMFNKDGSANARIDEMTKFWTGKYPKHRAPLVEAITINQKKPTSSVYLSANAITKASVVVTSAARYTYRYHWEILQEVVNASQGGAFEQEPSKVSFNYETLDTPMSISFKAPKQQGAYRLFVYVYDDQGKVGNANFPFYVKH